MQPENGHLPTKHTTAIGMLRLDDVPKTVHYAAMQSVISCTNYIKSCQPSGKPSEFDLLVSLAPAGYFTYLRAALLLIKLISLLSTLPSEENEVVFQSTELLCEALTELCSKLQSMDNASSGMLNLVAFSPEEGHSYVQRLSLLVLQLALPVFKQMLKTNKATASVGAVCCCSVFQALLPINRLNRHKSIAVKLAGSGALWCLSNPNKFHIVRSNCAPSTVSLSNLGAASPCSSGKPD
jgi:hypothetical protein